MMGTTLATIDDLEDFISNKWREYCAADPKRLATYEMRIPFQDWEARFFMRGLELGLFEVSSSDGLLHYQRLGGNVTGFFLTGRPRRCREVVTQFAALAELIEEYGWPVENVMAEPRERGKGIYPLDGLLFDSAWLEGRRTGQWPAVRIALEAKIQRSQVARLIQQINECVQRGPHQKSDHPSSKQSDHAKFQGILDWRPEYFLVVTPEERRIYSVRRHNETSFSLDVVKDIPRWSPR